MLKMRTFHLITHFSLGGAERVAANIAESQTHGMEYHVVEIMRGRTAYTPKFIAELEQAGVRCHRSWMPDVSFHFLFERIAALLFPLRMLYIMLRWHPDVIHTHTETPDLALYVFSRLFPFMLRRVKIVRTIHNTRLWTGLPRTAQWVETFFKSLGANIAISDSVRDSYADRFGEVPPIINNGVAEVEQKDYFNTQHPTNKTQNSEFKIAGEAENNSKLKTQNSKLNILFAGRLEPQKGVVVLCEVLKMLVGDARYHFTIAGDGSQRTLVEQTLADIASSGKPLNAQLVPPIFGLAGYMQSFDYLFMPSEFEGLSMLSMEASLNRLPVIANACPGLADTLPADWALLAHNNSLNDYRHIFNELLPTADHDALAQQAYAFAKDRFSVRTMQERYEARYKATGRSAEKAGR
ncbi:glycosyltransferase family 4 protein [Leyella stercorea]|uniref:glycosyltransferase family 4 protein n=1 Tax=Leyella stercorea TaxID=363265 RepID=UPI00242B59A9|nr:glycosyltransferase family 4 protein [Leyella stercorea]